jgi:hypothetical protein
MPIALRPLRFFAALAFSSLGLVTACSISPFEDADATDKELRVREVGTEAMATLVLKLARGTCLPGEGCGRPLAAAPTLRLDDTPMALEQPLRVTPGEHTLVVNETKATITLDAGATRTLALPVVRRVCVDESAAPLPPTDFGRLPTVRNARCPSAASIDGAPPVELPEASIDLFTGTTCNDERIVANLTRRATVCSDTRLGTQTVRSVRAGGICYRVLDRPFRPFCEAWVQGGGAGIGLPLQVSSIDTAVVPGTYAFAVETPNGPATDTRVVAEGEATDLEFRLPLVGTVPPRFDVNLDFQDPRELPDAVATRITSNCERSYSVPATARGVMNLKAFVFPECTYTMSVGGRSVPIPQNTSTNVVLYRLDIDDVLVTREDGSIFVTPGTYDIFFGGARVAGPFTTNTGLDLLPGEYEVVVRYPTAEGTKANRYVLKF